MQIKKNCVDLVLSRNESILKNNLDYYALVLNDIKAGAYTEQDIQEFLSEIETDFKEMIEYTIEDALEVIR